GDAPVRLIDGFPTQFVGVVVPLGAIVLEREQLGAVVVLGTVRSIRPHEVRQAGVENAPRLFRRDLQEEAALFRDVAKLNVFVQGEITGVAAVTGDQTPAGFQGADVSVVPAGENWGTTRHNGSLLKGWDSSSVGRPPEFRFT